MTVTIPAGELDKRVSVLRLKTQLTPDASGHVDETSESNWTEVGKRWVKFITKGSREFFRGEEIGAEITHQVVMRYDRESSQYTTKMRMKMGDRKFNIAEPPRNVNEQNTLLVFAVTEIK